MIIPSIDIMDGQAVQLIGGKEKVLDGGDPIPLARKFGRVGDVAVIDLDAALGRGNNRAIIEKLCKIAPCRVGGGVRDVETAMGWLDRGAAQVIIGTAARREVLRELPRERVMVALDALDGDVVVEGWQKGTGMGIEQRMRELEGLAGGFLVTFVEVEGRLGGTNMVRARELATLAKSVGATLTVAGGITHTWEIAQLDQMGVDAQIGMVLYTGRMDLAEGFAAPLTSDRPDGLWPTVVCDEGGVALGLAWSSPESLHAALESGCGVYHSRKRGLWKKGETSGATQKLLRVTADCDRDALRFLVAQEGAGFCHKGTGGCWGEPGGMRALMDTLGRRREAPEKAPVRAGVGGSYTARLLGDPSLLAAKLVEEAGELARAEGREAVIWEAADLVYFAGVAMERSGVTWAQVEGELDRRALKVVRRRGNAKGGGSTGNDE